MHTLKRYWANIKKRTKRLPRRWPTGPSIGIRKSATRKKFCNFPKKNNQKLLRLKKYTYICIEFSCEFNGPGRFPVKDKSDMKYFYQDLIGNVVELSKSVYYRTKKDWQNFTKEETGKSDDGEKFRKLICVKIGC